MEMEAYTHEEPVRQDLQMNLPSIHKAKDHPSRYVLKDMFTQIFKLNHTNIITSHPNPLLT